ncbi:peptidoglycan DD-metalloendopeptidase family protein [Patescibacteria group bacterium]|nr:peptidoglycan DD-metalloendopeptidase family protein [Patescibacteria group bacterium]
MRRFAALLVLLSLCAVSTSAYANEDIRSRIDEQQKKIQALEREIAQYEAALAEIGKSKATLSSEVTRIDTSRRKIAADIARTRETISETSLEIDRLTSEIGDRTTRIALGRQGIESTLRELAYAQDATLVELYASSGGLSAFWETVDSIDALQRGIRDAATTLKKEQEALAEARSGESARKARLSSLAEELSGQKQVLDGTRSERAALLASTRQSEAAFERLLKEKQEARLAFERELESFEAQLSYQGNLSLLPPVGRGVLSWPLDPAFLERCASRFASLKNRYCLTQYFGNTEFARSGAYRGAPHNGIDFGTPTGTKVLAAAAGEVVAVGDTDAFRGCYSYGKWILIRHQIGLTTLYAHLSHIGVRAGDVVSNSQFIGYTGKTGYATGPHLHFTVFASDGVRVVRMGEIKERTKCANATVPVAPTGAYLDPMTYL